MKKLVVSLLSALLMTFGLVSFSGSAQAASACPYTGCLHTQTFLSHQGAIKKPGRYQFTVRVKAGSAQPTGRLSLKVTGPKGYHYNKSVPAAKNPAHFLVRFKKAGTYRVVGKYTPYAHSVYYASKSIKTYKVK